MQLEALFSNIPQQNPQVQGKAGRQTPSKQQQARQPSQPPPQLQPQLQPQLRHPQSLPPSQQQHQQQQQQPVPAQGQQMDLSADNVIDDSFFATNLLLDDFNSLGASLVQPQLTQQEITGSNTNNAGGTGGNGGEGTVATVGGFNGNGTGNGTGNGNGNGLMNFDDISEPFGTDWLSSMGSGPGFP